MNGKKAKEIRRKVYGDISLRIQRQYNVIKHYVTTPKGHIIKNTFENVGLRSEYQKAKTQYLKTGAI